MRNLLRGLYGRILKWPLAGPFAFWGVGVLRAVLGRPRYQRDNVPLNTIDNDRLHRLEREMEQLRMSLRTLSVISEVLLDARK